jgi:uncharacterized protein YndB with AHSA1/START domain
MSILIILLIILAGLIVFPLIIGIFMRKEYNIKREVVINAPREKVFAYIRQLKNQDHFNKWVMVDPDMKRTFKGTDGTVGFIYGWNGNKRAGEGEQEITAITEGKSIETEIRFVRPFVSVASATMNTESVSENQTRVTWSNSSKMKWPLNIMLSMIEKMLAKDMDSSLGNLKKILES